MMKKLCEVKNELLRPVLQVGDAKTIRSLESLRCPHAGDCDKSKPRCDGMTGPNLLTISRIQDAIFAKGFIHVDDSEPIEPGISWRHRPRRNDF